MKGFKSVVMFLENQSDIYTVEPSFNKRQGHCLQWQNMFAMTRFCFIKVLFHILLLLGQGISFVM